MAVCTLASGLTACNSGNDGGSTPLEADTFALTSNNRLISFNRADPEVQTAVSVSGLQSGESLLGIDIRPGGTPAGQIIGLGSTGRLYAIDPDSGAATLKSTLAADPTDSSNPYTTLGSGDFGVDFNPVVDRLRVVNDSGLNLRINVDTGAVITDLPLNESGTVKTGISATAYSNSFASTCRTALFYIDSTSGTLLTTSDPNNGVLTSVGSLGSGASSGVDGFEIATDADGTNRAFAVLAGSGGSSISSINLSTGVASGALNVTGLAGGETLRGLTIAAPASAPAQTLGELAAVTASGKLVSFTSAAPQKLCTGPTAISGLGSETVLGADLRPANGSLVVLSSANKLYTVNPSTAAATLLSALAADPADTSTPFAGVGAGAVGVDFNPLVDRLRVVGTDGQNLRINVDTGLVTTDGTLNGTATGAAGAAYTNSLGSAGTVGTTSLFIIDPATDTLALQSPPNDGVTTAIGTLGVDADAVDFEINGRTGTALAAISTAGATASDLYSVNLATGAATRVNGIGTAAGLNERVSGLAYTANPAVTVFGVTDSNRLVRFTPQAPGTLTDDRAISGLQAGENVVGIDVRPANGELIAVTDANRLYRIDPMTGAAGTATPLVAASGDAFGGLTPTAAVGIDFNPVVDRLRIVNTAEQNLRANVATGAVITDTALLPAGSVFASAYNNSFSGTLTTTLFTLDSSTDTLLLQGSIGGSPVSPNAGTLTPVGALGVDVSDVGDLDISGGTNGIVLAALQTGGSGSTLYRVNLATGAATPVGADAAASAIGPTGTAPIVGLAVLVK
ncbi:MAG TPA: DUF4394 domain-containing protein [Fontimonas sp.]